MDIKSIISADITSESSDIISEILNSLMSHPNLSSLLLAGLISIVGVGMLGYFLTYLVKNGDKLMELEKLPESKQHKTNLSSKRGVHHKERD